VSIIPGIETVAPLLTESKSGFEEFAKKEFVSFSIFFKLFKICFSKSLEQVKLFSRK